MPVSAWVLAVSYVCHSVLSAFACAFAFAGFTTRLCGAVAVFVVFVCARLATFARGDFLDLEQSSGAIVGVVVGVSDGGQRDPGAGRLFAGQGSSQRDHRWSSWCGRWSRRLLQSFPAGPRGCKLRTYY